MPLLFNYLIVFITLFPQFVPLYNLKINLILRCVIAGHSFCLVNVTKSSALIQHYSHVNTMNKQIKYTKLITFWKFFFDYLLWFWFLWFIQACTPASSTFLSWFKSRVKCSIFFQLFSKLRFYRKANNFIHSLGFYTFYYNCPYIIISYYC